MTTPNGIDEIVEEVVARAVAARAPLDAVAGVLHAAAAAHHRFEVRHQEGDVVQRVVVGVAERDAVVVAVAVHEGHDPRAVRQPEAERPLEEGLRGSSTSWLLSTTWARRIGRSGASCASACAASPCTTWNTRPCGSRSVRPVPPAGLVDRAGLAQHRAASGHAWPARRPRAPRRCAPAASRGATAARAAGVQRQQVVGGAGAAQVDAAAFARHFAGARCRCRSARSRRHRERSARRCARRRCGARSSGGSGSGCRRWGVRHSRESRPCLDHPASGYGL